MRKISYVFVILMLFLCSFAVEAQNAAFVSNTSNNSILYQSAGTTPTWTSTGADTSLLKFSGDCECWTEAPNLSATDRQVLSYGVDNKWVNRTITTFEDGYTTTVNLETKSILIKSTISDDYALYDPKSDKITIRIGDKIRYYLWDQQKQDFDYVGELTGVLEVSQ